MDSLKAFVLVSWIAVYIFERYLHKRQVDTLEEAGIPFDLRGSIGKKRFAKCKTYLLMIRYYENIHQFLVLVFDAILLFSPVVTWLWEETDYSLQSYNEYHHSIMFLGVLLLCRLSLDYISLVPQNKIAPEDGYAKVQQKSYKLDFLSLVLKKMFGGAAATVAIIYLKNAGAPSAALYALPCVLAVTCYWLSFLVPNTDFGTLTPLEKGPGEYSKLWAKILVTAAANGFPTSSILLGSDPICTYNPTLVYITGFPKKTIIIDQRLPYQGKDGLFSNINERAATVLREIGRWKFSNPMFDSAIIIVLTLIYVGIFDYVAYSSDLYSSIFGFGERSVAVGILLFLYVIPLANVFVRFALNAKTRSQEFKADVFTKDLGYGTALRSCLLKFMENQMSTKEIATDPWFSAYRLSEPSFLERLDAL